MFDNFWLVIGQLLILTGVVFFIIAFLGMAIVTVLNSYQNNKSKNEKETYVLVAKLFQESDTPYTIEDFLKDTKK
jgi:hypothetical protein